MEYTLSHIYGLKAEDEEDPIIRVIYQKLRDDSSKHLALIENALKTLGKSLPKPIMIRIAELDPSTMKREEINIDKVDTALEEMEAAAATLFALFAEDFPNPRLSRFFSAMRDDEKLHLRLLKEVRAYKRRGDDAADITS